jgi:hypothetical protein
VSQIRTSATAELICRNCRRKLTGRGFFWTDEFGSIYCATAIGPHIAVAKEPDSQ